MPNNQLSNQTSSQVSPLLEVTGLQSGYGRKQVVHDVSLTIRPGEIVALLGHNGAGKTTTIRALMGLLPVNGGSVSYLGAESGGRPVRENTRAGMALVPSEHFVFPDLSVRDNLLLGAINAPHGVDREERLAYVETLLPLLAERHAQAAGTLSGGQQRMVSVGIALMAQPLLMLLDEPSLGLAPAVVDQIFGTLRGLADRDGLGILLLEQNVKQALAICDRVYVMRSGTVFLEETAAQMRARTSYWDLF